MIRCYHHTMPVVNSWTDIPVPGYRIGQSFTPSESFTCVKAVAFAYRVGTITGNLTYSIYLADVDGHPTGPALGTAAVSYSKVDTGTPGVPLKGVFDPGIYLQAGTAYVLMVDVDAGDVSNHLRFHMTDGNLCASGHAVVWRQFDTSWIENADEDMLFELWDSNDSGVKRYLALGNIGGVPRIMELYRQPNGIDTVSDTWRSAVNSFQACRLSANHFYTVATVTNSTKIYRFNADLTADTGWASNGTKDCGAGSYGGIDVTDDDYAAICVNYTTPELLVINPDGTTLLSNAPAITGYSYLGPSLDVAHDVVGWGGGNGMGGWFNASRAKLSDGSSAGSWWANAGYVQVSAFRLLNGNMFAAHSGTVKEHSAANPGSDLWSYNYPVSPGTPTQMIHVADEGALFLVTTRANSRSVVRCSSADGTQIAVFDTGAAAKQVYVNRDGNLLISGTYGNDGTGSTGLRELDFMLNVLWRFNPGYALSFVGAVDTVINLQVIVPTIEGHGTVGPAVGALRPITTTIPAVYPLTLRPETPLIEHLLFQTKIHRKLNGREQRLALRKCPRLQFEMKFTDHQSWMESYLYARAMEAMAVPFWHEPAYVTTAYAAGENHVHVGTTAYSQFKAGQWACLARVDGTADVVEVASLTSNQIVFNAGAPHSYPVGSEVFPVSRCWAESISVTKRLRASEYDMKLFVEPVDNDLGITAYGDGELSITDVNYGDSLTETWDRPFYRVDGGYGLISQTVILPHADKGSKLGFRTRSRAELWALRLMFYRLHGRAIAFNLASFSEDLIPNSALTGFSTALNIERCGFTEYVQGTRSSIRVVLNDGTVLPRTIESSRLISSTTERLTVDSAWPYTIQPSDVRRIEYLDLVRLDTDDIVIRHQNALGWASCEVPVVRVYAQLES